MKDSRREGTEPTQRLSQPYPPYTDQAYGGHSPYPSLQDPRVAPPPTDFSPTAKLPQYWLQEQLGPDQPTQQLRPGRPRTPRWLWVAAAASAVLVGGLVIALVLTDSSPPLPAMPNSTTSASASSPPSTPNGTATAPPKSGGAVDAIVYQVTGEGRAISISYRDSDDVTQTEFNVSLPWSKHVNLPKSGNNANVTIINIGHDVTCTLMVAGQEVRQHTGAGLTVCDAPA